MDKKQRNFITKALRRLSMMCENHQIAERAARIAPATWLCNYCGDWLYSGSKSLEKAKESAKPPKNVVFRASKHKMDHIDPVECVEGWDGWDNLMIRLFFTLENWQCLCPEHHQMKTNLENEYRRKFKEYKKKGKCVKKLSKEYKKKCKDME